MPVGRCWVGRPHSIDTLLLTIDITEETAPLGGGIAGHGPMRDLPSAFDNDVGGDGSGEMTVRAAAAAAWKKNGPRGAARALLARD